MSNYIPKKGDRVGTSIIASEDGETHISKVTITYYNNFGETSPIYGEITKILNDFAYIKWDTSYLNSSYKKVKLDVLMSESDCIQKYSELEKEFEKTAKIILNKMEKWQHI